MKKIILLLSIVSLVTFSSEYFEDMFKMIDKNNSNLKTSINIFNPSDEGIREEYKKLGLDNNLDHDIFKTAVDGFKKVKKKKRNVLTIVDFSKSSSKKRFFVIDFDQNKVVYSSLVAH